MTIATRRLTLTTPSGSRPLDIRIMAPQAEETGWSCAFEIDWPDGLARKAAYGVDSAQALILALQMVGICLYTSQYHAAGQLSFEKPGQGYGFPGTSTISDLLLGDDKLA